MTSSDKQRAMARFEEHMSANPLYHDVEGAPFRIGEGVRIVCSEDDTFDRAFLGRIGIVKYFEYECGCGQSFPLDPMIGIEFDNGTVEEFWSDELRCNPAPSKELVKRQSKR